MWRTNGLIEASSEKKCALCGLTSHPNVLNLCTQCVSVHAHWIGGHQRIVHSTIFNGHVKNGRVNYSLMSSNPMQQSAHLTHSVHKFTGQFGCNIRPQKAHFFSETASIRPLFSTRPYSASTLYNYIKTITHYN